MTIKLLCELFSDAHGMNLKTLVEHVDIKIGQICCLGTVKSNPGHESLDYVQTTPLFTISWDAIIYKHFTIWKYKQQQQNCKYIYWKWRTQEIRHIWN